MDEKDTSIRKGTAAAGLSVAGAMLTGAIGLIGGILLIDDGRGGMYLLASAVAFGLLANAVFRR